MRERLYHLMEKIARGWTATAVSFLPVTPYVGISEAALQQLVPTRSVTTRGAMPSLAYNLESTNLGVRPYLLGILPDRSFPDPFFYFRWGEIAEVRVGDRLTPGTWISRIDPSQSIPSEVIMRTIMTSGSVVMNVCEPPPSSKCQIVSSVDISAPVKTDALLLDGVGYLDAISIAGAEIIAGKGSVNIEVEVSNSSTKPPFNSRTLAFVGELFRNFVPLAWKNR